MTKQPSRHELAAELESLRARLTDAEAVAHAIRNGHVDAIRVSGEHGAEIYTLHGADQAYRQLVETMSEGAATLSADGVILYCNHRLARMLERPHDRVMGSALRDYLPPADQQALAEILGRAGTEPSRREITLTTSDGRLVPGYLSISRVHGDAAETVFGLVLTDLTQQRSLERVIAAERLASSILEQAAEAIVVCDERGLVIRASQAAQRLCDANPLLQPFAAAFPLRTAAAGPFLLAAVLQGQSLRDVDVALDRGGRKLDFILNAGPLRSGEEILGCVVNLTNVTERRQSEEALRNNEARLRDVMFSVGDWVWETDAQGAYTYSSAKGDELLRRSHEEIIGKTPFDFMAPDEARRVAAIFSDLVARKAPIKDLENWNVRLNGERVCLLTNGVPILDDAGRLTGYRGVDKDITEHKRAESALRLQSAALNAAANAIVITGLDGTIEWLNAAFTTLSGYDAEDAIGRNPRELVKSGVHDRAFYQHLWDTILAGKVWQGEMTNRRKDGQQYTEEMTVTPVRDARGAIAHFIAIKRDLTEHHEMEARFRQSQKMETVGQLAGGVAHDFNNLLTVILTTADLALGDLKEGDPLRADFQQVRQAADRAAALTRQLLAFSRRQLLQPESLNLNAVVVGMQSMLRRLIGENIEFAFAPAKDLGSVKADLGQLEQVIMNLVVNARDAMPDGGTLTIETRNVELDEAYAAGHPAGQPGPHVMLAISDTGVGMNEATRQRAFEPFFTTKEVGKGSGLGLSTVYGIVEQSGGSIWVYSEIGKGTTFKIYFPEVARAARTSQPALTVTPAGGTETVLIAEDDAGVRHAAMRLLQAVGYNVLTASSGQEALSLLERHEGPVHLMLTDMVMPGMGGSELATRLQAVRPELKIIFSSGYTNDAILQDGLLDATAHFIGKPYTAVDLRRKVREVLDA